MAKISLSGADLSWMKDPANRLPDEMKAEHRRAERRGRSHQLMPDLDVAYNKQGGFESLIDGQFITSRSQLREHNKRHNVIQAGENHGRTKELMKEHMRWNPEARKENGFSWTERDGGRSSRGNLTEI